MASRQATLRAARAPRDRLLVMLFLTAALHGLLILGVTFHSALAGGRGAPGLQVLLVSTRLPSAPRNATAAYLAQRTQLGSGNTRGNVAPRRPAPSGTPQGATGGAAVVPDGGRAGRNIAEPVLTTRGFSWSTQVNYLTAGLAGASEAATPGGPVETARGSSNGPVRLSGPKRELWVSPDTRSTLVAPYLVAWRRKVERIGTLNFPVAARHAGPHANPVIEVAIDANGTLARAVIRRSSGDPALDHAALTILHLASPFDPFPPALARRYSVLRFTYEWQFVGGRMHGTVTVP